jgi:transposase, IS5 family
VKVDKVITSYVITYANGHDPQMLPKLVDKHDEHHEVSADSAYEGNRIEGVLEQQEARNRIHKNSHRNHPLTEKQKVNNR